MEKAAQKSSSNDIRLNRRTLIIGGVVLAAVVVAIGFVIFSMQGASASVDAALYSDIPQSRTTDGAFVLGDPDAPVTVVEFADFMCPHCQEYHSTMKQFIEEHVATGQARLEYRMFPTVDRQGITARLVECAYEQDEMLFWPAHDLMYGLTSAGFNDESARRFAQQLGLSYGDLLSCANEADQFIVDAQVGQREGVSGTPAIKVRFDDGPMEWMQAGGQTFNRGAVPYSTINQVVLSAQS